MFNIQFHFKHIYEYKYSILQTKVYIFKLIEVVVFKLVSFEYIATITREI